MITSATIAKRQLRLRKSELTQGLLSAIPLNGTLRDLVSGNMVTLTSTGGFTPLGGSSLRGNGSASVGSIPLNLSSATRLTICFWMYWDTFANDDDLAFELTANTNTNDGGILIDPNAALGRFQMYSRILSTAGGKEASMARYGEKIWYFYTLYIDRNALINQGMRMLINGVDQSLTYSGVNVNGLGTTFANSTLYLFSRNNSSLFGAGNIKDLCFWNRELSMEEIHKLYKDTPGSLYEYYSPASYKVPGSGPTYTLTASAGSFSLTGVASSLVASRLLTASAGSFILTGQNTGLRAGRVLAATVGTFALDGKNINLKFDRVMSAGTGTFTLTGNVANLVYSPLTGPTYTLTAEKGTFTVDGQTAQLLANRVLSAQVGEFDLVGNDAGLYVVVPGTGPVLYIDLISKNIMLLQRLD